jgi:histidine ammonia-lyase
VRDFVAAAVAVVIDRVSSVVTAIAAVVDMRLDKLFET